MRTVHAAGTNFGKPQSEARASIDGFCWRDSLRPLPEKEGKFLTRGRRHEEPIHDTSSGKHVVHVRALPPRHQGGLPREGKARPACKQMDEPVARDAVPGEGHPGQEARETEREFKRIIYNEVKHNEQP